MSSATTSSSLAPGWAQLRQQTRLLESQTESLFHTYSQFASVSSIPPKPTEDEKRIETQLDDLLSRRESLISHLSRLLDSESALTASALKQNNLSLHRNALHLHKRDLARLKASLAAARERTNLLSTVRSDIHAYRSANPEAEYMLDERRRVEASHGVADGVLSQAYAVRESFGAQREMLASVNRRIVGAASQVPGINSLIGRIGSKKRRDGVILGSFVAACVLLLLYFM
ncbi:MAG: hypothetical protein M1829_000167 [Trizodia sp. TS-e1964]|nr:MAG: hypothetical protein M1829_000167 [Trizodia sp. TS-e1964]